MEESLDGNPAVPVDSRPIIDVFVIEVHLSKFFNSSSDFRISFPPRQRDVWERIIGPWTNSAKGGILMLVRVSQ